MEFKEIPVKESRSANILACYGFPGLRRHKSDDEVSLVSAGQLLCCSLLCFPNASAHVAHPAADSQQTSVESTP